MLITKFSYIQKNKISIQQNFYLQEPTPAIFNSIIQPILKKMNAKEFQTAKFASNHYMRVLKARSTIDNSPSKINQVPYSSRNQTSLTRFQESNKTKKLVDKLLEINDSHYNSKYLKQKSQKKSKISTKNRKLTFSKNKSYEKREKTLVNRFKSLQKSQQVEILNYDLMQKIVGSKSNYQEAFSKGREKKLQMHSSILKKSNRQDQIRRAFFGKYEDIKFKNSVSKPPSRPSTKRKTTKNSQINVTTEPTRPHTAN